MAEDYESSMNDATASKNEIEIVSASETDEAYDLDHIQKSLQRSYVLNDKTGRFNLCMTCLICKRTFPALSTAVRHARTHAQSKPFGCDKCGKKFTQEGNRNLHKNTGVCARRQLNHAYLQGWNSKEIFNIVKVKTRPSL